MPAPAIIGAVVAVAAAAEALTPIAIGLAVIATAGAVASTVGTITGDKTLSMVGNIMGAVGSIGGIANGLGFFGEAAAGGLSGVTNAAGGAAESVAPTAISVSEATGGLNAYTPEFLQTVDPGFAGTGSFAGGEAALNAADVASTASSQPGQIVNMLSGETNPLTVPTAESPAAIQASEFTPGAATDTTANASSLTPDPTADLAVNPEKGLLQQPSVEPSPQIMPDATADPSSGSQLMVNNQSVTPTDYMNTNVEQGGLLSQNPATAYADGSTADPTVMAQGEDIYAGSSPAGQGGVNANDPARAAQVSPSRQGVYGDASTTGPSGDMPGVQPGKVTGTATTGLETPAPAQTTPATTAPASAPVTGNNMPSTDAMLAWKDAKPGDITRANNSIWGDIWGFAKENKSLVLGGMMSLGSFMSGALSPKTPAEVDALNAQAERNRAAAQLENTQNQLMQRRLANMGQPIPVASRTGLINMAPVTGRV